MQRLADFIAGIDGANKRRAWQRHVDALQGETAHHWDGLLSALPDDAWHALKESTLRQIDQHDPARSWRQVEDRFNEARAFLYLRANGCEGVAFAPASMEAAGPDLLARRGAMTIACEVKSIRLDASSAHRMRKLRSRLQDAVVQLAMIDTGEAYIYLVVTGCDIATVRDCVDVTALPPCRLIVDCDGSIETFN